MSTLGELRCSAQLRALGADPGGTAGSFDGWVLASWPLPWPHDLGDIAELQPLRDTIRSSGAGRLRLQGVVPVEDRPGLVLHRRGTGPFDGFVRTTAAAPSADALAGLLTAPGSAGRDVLVCTHGRRDRCCGSFGTELWQDLDAGGGLGDHVALWRTSHTGGHRFAPTMVVLPEGTVWGVLGPELARRIVRREGPVAEVLGAYRGCSGLGGPPLQALERAVLGEVGWSLLDLPRSGSHGDDGRWRLEVGGPDPQVWEATVTPGRTWPVPECGSPLDQARKSDTSLDVTGLHRTD